MLALFCLSFLPLKFYGNHLTSNFRFFFIQAPFFGLVFPIFLFCFVQNGMRITRILLNRCSRILWVGRTCIRIGATLFVIPLPEFEAADSLYDRECWMCYSVNNHFQYWGFVGMAFQLTQFLARNTRKLVIEWNKMSQWPLKTVAKNGQTKKVQPSLKKKHMNGQKRPRMKWVGFSVRFERVGSTFYKFTTIIRVKVRSIRPSQSFLFVI